MAEERTKSSTRRERARALRRKATEAERQLWWQLRHRLPLEGTYFRRQVPLGPYLADFVCLKHRLVIELDGDQHGQADAMAYDAARTAFLQQQGYVVLRFWNHQVFREIDSVLDAIAAAISARQGSPSTLTPGPSPQGRGEVALTARTCGSSSG